ncbi:MAG: hypothetical protein AAFX52_14540 [Pseudomonadota bacterium]
MVVAKKTLGAMGGLMLALAGAAHAHRMPEVYITLEDSDLAGEAITAVTLRLYAEDAIALLSAHDRPVSNLETRDEHEALAQLSVLALTIEGGPLSFLGGEVDGRAVLLYLTAPPALEVIDSAILSTVYDQWTNHVTDQTRDGSPDLVFTQGGELEHVHRH